MAARNYQVQVFFRREGRKEDDRRTDLDRPIAARTIDIALSAAREAYTRGGYDVLGLSPSEGDRIIARIRNKPRAASGGAR